MWWEKRRIFYNLFLFALGLPSLVLFFLFAEASGVLASGEDAVEPMALFLTPFAANFAYTFGWIMELCVRDGSRPGELAGPRILRFGLGFSTVVVLLPTLLWAGIWLLSLLKST